MITLFEEYTETLTEREVEMLPAVELAFSKCKEPRKAKEVCNLIELLWYQQTEEFIKVSEVTLRKFSNHIRRKGLLPLIATSKGYFITEDKELIKKQIQSLFERASSIKQSAEGLKKFL